MRAIEFCNKVFDGTHDTPKPVSNGKLLITSKHIANRCLDTTSAYYISEDDYNNINKRSRVQQFDVLFSMIGTVGNVYIERSENIDYAIKNMGVFSCGDRDKALWLYYYLQSPKVKMIINSYLSGAVQKFVPLEFLRNLDIPDYSRQCKSIINVLTAIDDKIALNKRINDKLEAMAKRLYDYWFVQFDFPDENGRPYKSFGGKMVWNETLKREIPEGWEVKPLKQFASYRTDTTKSENAYNYISTDNILPDKQGISDETIYPASGNIFQYKQNDILISNIRPYFKKIWLASYNGTCSTDILCICSNQHEHNSYIYRTLWRDDFFDYVMQGAKGSKMPRGDKEHIMNYPICFHNYLTNVLLKPFNDKCLVIQEMLYRNNNETMRLTALRDRLLPLLMNGQVVVDGDE